MPLPSSYLTSFKNVPAILDSIQEAQAPERFTVKFLQDLGYTSAADRLVIKVLKTLGLLRESGEPTTAYHEFLDPSQSGRVLADGLRSAYADLFQINKNAQTMSHADVKAKFKTISQGAYSDDVLGKMANTFLAFAKHADFNITPVSRPRFSAIEHLRPATALRDRKKHPSIGANSQTNLSDPQGLYTRSIYICLQLVIQQFMMRYLPVYQSI